MKTLFVLCWMEYDTNELLMMIWARAPVMVARARTATEAAKREDGFMGFWGEMAVHRRRRAHQSAPAPVMSNKA